VGDAAARVAQRALYQLGLIAKHLRLQREACPTLFDRRGCVARPRRRARGRRGLDRAQKSATRLLLSARARLREPEPRKTLGEDGRPVASLQRGHGRERDRFGLFVPSLRDEFARPLLVAPRDALGVAERDEERTRALVVGLFGERLRRLTPHKRPIVARRLDADRQRCQTL